LLITDQTGPTRVGYGRKLRYCRFSLTASFKPWNWLPKELKTAASLDAFKHGLDALMKTERWNGLMGIWMI
jgi:hypothetical protein